MRGQETGRPPEMPGGWGGHQKCWEDREVWGTAHLQSDRREAAIPGQRPRRRLRLLLRPSAPLLPGAGWALC